MSNRANCKKFFLIAVLLIACIFLMSACSNSSSVTRTENTTEIQNSDYKQSPDFVFEVDKDHITVNKWGKATINCSLKNVSDKDYFIEHGAETITYSYNGPTQEELELISIMDTFKSNSEINRTLNLRVTESGKITVYATFDVKPDKFSDQRETYQYTKEIDVEVNSLFSK